MNKIRFIVSACIASLLLFAVAFPSPLTKRPKLSASRILAKTAQQIGPLDLSGE